VTAATLTSLLAAQRGAPLGGGRERPAGAICEGRSPQGGPGARGAARLPQGPPARATASIHYRAGRDGFPPWGFLFQGAPRKGGSRGGNQAGGGAARPSPLPLAARGGRGDSSAVNHTIRMSKAPRTRRIGTSLLVETPPSGSGQARAEGSSKQLSCADVRRLFVRLSTVYPP
jgi:hypothetical protein